jgi:serine/threonine protein kinase
MIVNLNFIFQVAIKTIKKAKIETEADLIRIRREIQIMSSVSDNVL